MNLEATLSDREYEVLEPIALGKPKKWVADKLGISENTVANHAKKIYTKTDVHCVQELTLWYIYTKYKIKEIVLSILICLVSVGEFNGLDMRKNKTHVTVRGIRFKRKDHSE